MLPIISTIAGGIGTVLGSSLSEKISSIFGGDSGGISESELEQQRTRSESSNAVMAQYDRAKQFINDTSSPEFIEIHNAVAHEANTPNNFVWDVSGITSLVDNNIAKYQLRVEAEKETTVSNVNGQIFADLSALIGISDFIKSTSKNTVQTSPAQTVVQSESVPVQQINYTPILIIGALVLGAVLLIKR